MQELYGVSRWKGPQQAREESASRGRWAALGGFLAAATWTGTALAGGPAPSQPMPPEAVISPTTAAPLEQNTGPGLLAWNAETGPLLLEVNPLFFSRFERYVNYNSGTASRLDRVRSKALLALTTSRIDIGHGYTLQFRIAPQATGTWGALGAPNGEPALSCMRRSSACTCRWCGSSWVASR